MDDLRAMTDVYLGRRGLTQTMDAGLVEIDAPRSLLRALPR